MHVESAAIGLQTRPPKGWMPDAISGADSRRDDPSPPRMMCPGSPKIVRCISTKLGFWRETIIRWGRGPASHYTNYCPSCGGVKEPVQRAFELAPKCQMLALATDQSYAANRPHQRASKARETGGARQRIASKIHPEGGLSAGVDACFYFNSNAIVREPPGTERIIGGAEAGPCDSTVAAIQYSQGFAHLKKFG